MVNDLTRQIKSRLSSLGADIIAFGDLNELPADVREGLPVGISVAVVYPKQVIRGIKALPTQEYSEWYTNLNERLDRIVIEGASFLKNMGYEAIAQTREYVGNGEMIDNTLLPHKTIATRAGVGWIGKSALLVTREYGSSVRLSSILTNAPLETAKPINESGCDGCMICTDACPAKAISGKVWKPEIYRDLFFDPVKCRTTARERAKLGFGGEMTICGKCIEICPYTQQYITD